MLFRGKAGTSGWVKGSLVKIDDEYTCIVKHYDCPRDLPINVLINFNSAIVIPSTVGRYSGKKDKNDVEIFDGDIIKNEYEKGKYQYFRVFYCKQTYMWKVANQQGASGSLCRVKGALEVVGNIYDTPDWLGGAKND